MFFITTIDQELPLVNSSVTDEDHDDLRACRNGDEHAYARIVQRYEILIARQMWRFNRDPQRHEELVQEVFVEAYTSLHTFKGTAPFEHWLRKIATRTGYRFWKHKARDTERKEQLHQHKDTLMPSPDTASASEAGEYLYTLLETLPAQDRIVLTLLYFEGWNTAEIADHLGWSLSLVKVRAFRARKKLKTKLEAAGYDNA